MPYFYGWLSIAVPFSARAIYKIIAYIVHLPVVKKFVELFEPVVHSDSIPFIGNICYRSIPQGLIYNLFRLIKKCLYI